jgi:hypothetical protein
MNEQRPNLLELKPARKVEWETGPDGRVILIIPKFRGAMAKKWLLPWLSRPNFRVKLDVYGSFIWQHCDGRTPVSEMAGKMVAAFGPEIEPVYERIAAFMRKLEREAFLINTYPELVSELKGDSDGERNGRTEA